MKALVCTAPRSFEYQQLQLPEPTPGHVILRIRRIGICGTDIHAYEGTQPYFNYPRLLGHELAAELVDGDIPGGFQLGDTVTFIPYLNCGHCIACRSGRPNCCVSMKVYGVHIDGGMVEFLSVPTSSLVNGRGLSAEALALAEPLSIGAHAVDRAGISPGEFVLVVGAGPIGLGVIEFARIAGANVIAIDTNIRRLNFAKEELSVEHTLRTGDDRMMEQLLDITRGDMPTAVFDATGNLAAINHSFQYMSHAGRYVLVGLQKGDISFSHPEFHKREATLMSSRNATRRDFESVLDALQQKRIDPFKYITQTMSFESAAGNFENLLDQSRGTIKAMITMD